MGHPVKPLPYFQIWHTALSAVSLSLENVNKSCTIRSHRLCNLKSCCLMSLKKITTKKRKGCREVQHQLERKRITLNILPTKETWGGRERVGGRGEGERGEEGGWGEEGGERERRQEG
ncbi:hypothetical protein MUK42_13065 [Musa troglodytarum]|uniref:Uncharacterized protein n=1 Tax=Musa troglodytarum TaxID=320322 RepID=A0A9E7HX49_9LILI|nr:hypothetical protein MUK42_13065 [Musa troglodytarum]